MTLDRNALLAPGLGLAECERTNWRGEVAIASAPEMLRGVSRALYGKVAPALLARDLGVTPEVVSRWLNGTHTPKAVRWRSIDALMARRLAALADALEVYRCANKPHGMRRSA